MVRSSFQHLSNLVDATLAGLPDKSAKSIKLACCRRQRHGVVSGRRVLPVLAHTHLILSLDCIGRIKARVVDIDSVNITHSELLDHPSRVGGLPSHYSYRMVRRWTLAKNQAWPRSTCFRSACRAVISGRSTMR